MLIANYDEIPYLVMTMFVCTLLLFAMIKAHDDFQ